jgi:hypothetical protein
MLGRSIATPPGSDRTRVDATGFGMSSRVVVSRAVRPACLAPRIPNSIVGP